MHHPLRAFGTTILFGISIFAAVYVLESSVFEQFFAVLGEFRLLGAFIAGFFFTFFVTITPASVVLGELMHAGTPIWQVAVMGAAGAVVGDLLIYSVLEKKTKNLAATIRRSHFKRLKLVVGSKAFRILSPTIGALIIISPFPDELGLALMGFSRLRRRVLIPLSFILNGIGILLIGGIVSITG